MDPSIDQRYFTLSAKGNYVQKDDQTNTDNKRTLVAFIIHGIWTDIQRHGSLRLLFPSLSLPVVLVDIVLEYEIVPWVLSRLKQVFNEMMATDSCTIMNFTSGPVCNFNVKFDRMSWMKLKTVTKGTRTSVEKWSFNPFQAAKCILEGETNKRVSLDALEHVLSETYWKFDEQGEKVNQKESLLVERFLGYILSFIHEQIFLFDWAGYYCARPLFIRCVNADQLVAAAEQEKIQDCCKWTDLFLASTAPSFSSNSPSCRPPEEQQREQ